MKIFPIIPAAILLLIIFSGSAFAQDAQPGDACATVNQYRVSGAVENAGKVYHMTCQGGVWKLIFASDIAGNIGIGTASPNLPLHIVADNPDMALDFSATPVGGYAQIYYRNQGVNQASLGWDRVSGNLVLEPDLVGDGGYLRISATSAIDIPEGTTGQRPTGDNGMLRYNTTTSKFEGYENGAWTNLVGAGSNAERGRMIIDTTNNRLYICNGATRGWDYVALTD